MTGRLKALWTRIGRGEHLDAIAAAGGDVRLWFSIRNVVDRDLRQYMRSCIRRRIATIRQLRIDHSRAR